MTAFVTGIAGFAGSHLAAHLLARGDRVAGLLREPGDAGRNLGELAARLELHAGDVTDLGRLAAILGEVRPDRIYHLAGLASPRLSFHDPLGFYHVNTIGTATLFEAMAMARLGEARVLLVSSAECYGRAGGTGPITEATPLRPVSPYGGSKAAAEAVAVAAFEGRGVQVVTARAFNHTGARQEADFAAAAFARQIAMAERGASPAEIRVGRLDAVRDYSDVGEVVAAYAALIERGRPGDAYNVGSGRGFAMSEVLAALVERSRVPLRVVDDPARHRPVEVASLVADTRKLVATVGSAPARALGETLGELLESWRARAAASG